MYTRLISIIWSSRASRSTRPDHRVSTDMTSFPYDTDATEEEGSGVEDSAQLRIKFFNLFNQPSQPNLPDIDFIESLPSDIGGASSGGGTGNGSSFDSIWDGTGDFRSLIPCWSAFGILANDTICNNLTGLPISDKVFYNKTETEVGESYYSTWQVVVLAILAGTTSHRDGRR